MININNVVLVKVEEDLVHGKVYLYLSPKQPITTSAVQDGMVLDFGADGRLVGIEFESKAVIPEYIKEAIH